MLNMPGIFISLHARTAIRWRGRTRRSCRPFGLPDLSLLAVSPLADHRNAGAICIRALPPTGPTQHLDDRHGPASPVWWCSHWCYNDRDAGVFCPHWHGGDGHQHWTWRFGFRQPSPTDAASFVAARWTFRLRSGARPYRKAAAHAEPTGQIILLHPTREDVCAAWKAHPARHGLAAILRQSPGTGLPACSLASVRRGKAHRRQSVMLSQRRHRGQRGAGCFEQCRKDHVLHSDAALAFWCAAMALTPPALTTQGITWLRR